MNNWFHRPTLGGRQYKYFTDAETEAGRSQITGVGSSKLISIRVRLWTQISPDSQAGILWITAYYFSKITRDYADLLLNFKSYPGSLLTWLVFKCRTWFVFISYAFLLKTG